MKVTATTSSGLAHAPERLVRVDYQSSQDGVEDWALALPPEQGDTWIICIHGHGSHGDQLYTREDLKTLWLPVFLETRLGILAPNLRDNAWMAPAAAMDLHGLLEYLRSEYGARRFIFASGSMGGTSNIIYAVLFPEDVHAAIGLGAIADLASYYRWCRTYSSGVIKEIADAIETAYHGNPDQVPALYERHSSLCHADRLTMPVYLAHGTDDVLMPVEEPRRLAAKMAGTKTFHYEEIDRGGHDTPMNLMPQALEWVFRCL